MTAGISPDTLAASVSARDMRQMAALISTNDLSREQSRGMVQKLEAMADRVDRLTGEAGKRIQNTVADIPDSELVRRAVMNAGMARSPASRGMQVERAFGLGSTYAGQLCRRMGLDPEECIE